MKFYDLPVGAEFRRAGRPAIWRKEDSRLAFLPDAPKPGGHPVYLLMQWDADVEAVSPNEPPPDLETLMALARFADALLQCQKLHPRRKEKP